MTRSRGTLVRTLRVGEWALVLEGLDPSLAAGLDRRWGPFVSEGRPEEPDLRIAVREAGPEVGLGAWERGERYRIEAQPGAGAPRLRSYGFALVPASARAYHLDLVSGEAEPALRRLDNAARLLVARLAVGAGGLALHGAAVLNGGHAHVLAGPSRAGKSTAVAKLGWVSLGDDFAVIVPGSGGFRSAAVPFDNAESVASSAPTGAWPLRAVWRLEQGAKGGRRALGTTAAASALTACAAFPWTYPDLAGDLLDAALRCAREVRCEVLTFALDTDLEEWVE